MKVNVLSVQEMKNKDGVLLYRVFASLPDGAVGNFWSTNPFFIGDSVELSISISKDCKFVVRPVIKQ